MAGAKQIKVLLFELSDAFFPPIFYFFGCTEWLAGSQFADQELKSKYRVLATGPPGNFHPKYFSSWLVESMYAKPTDKKGRLYIHLQKKIKTKRSNSKVKKKSYIAVSNG